MSPPGMRRVATFEELVERDKDHDCGGFGVSRVCVKVDAVADGHHIDSFGKQHLPEHREPLILEAQV